MAEHGRRGRDGALGLVGAVALGAVTASFGGLPALADEPTYPSWQDVQQAKRDTAAASTEATRITGLITGLQDAADAAGRIAQIAAERFHRAKAAEDAARDRHRQLAEQADLAQATARTSRMRAGLLAAHLARSGGGEMTANLLLDADGAGSLLYRMATMSQLTQSQQISGRAVADEREAAALGEQADVAATELQVRAQAAQAALTEAQHSSAAATAAVAAEQQHANRLLAQLADLQQTSTRIAAQHVAGVQRERDVAAAAAAARRRAAAAAPSSGPTGGVGTAPPVGSAPVVAVPSAPSDGAASGSTPTAAPPAPNSAQAASAVAFARDQIGDMYRFAGAGPNVWDCSGLTMQSYASVGIQIGGHSATAQYELAAAQGELVPYADVQVGDLIFYTDGGGDMYHVAVYSGSGMMIEAPYDGVPVREVPVRSYQRVGQVARPTA